MNALRRAVRLRRGLPLHRRLTRCARLLLLKLTINKRSQHDSKMTTDLRLLSLLRLLFSKPNQRLLREINRLQDLQAEVNCCGGQSTFHNGPGWQRPR